MTRTVFAAAVVSVFCLTAPAAAQETDDSPDGLMERGAQMLLEGLLQRMEPALDDLQGLAQEFGPALNEFMAEMGPALQDLLDEVEDWSAYHPPEVLENGDIIIRRKTPTDVVPPEGEIEI